MLRTNAKVILIETVSVYQTKWLPAMARLSKLRTQSVPQRLRTEFIYV